MLYFFERLDKFMKFKGLNDNKLTIETGISNGIIGKGRKRGSLSQDNISKILHTYPELNANWLFTGNGEMLKSDNKNEVSDIKIDESGLSSIDKLINAVDRLSLSEKTNSENIKELIAQGKQQTENISKLVELLCRQNTNRETDLIEIKKGADNTDKQGKIQLSRKKITDNDL
jgi:hypothetical protein